MQGAKRLPSPAVDRFNLFGTPVVAFTLDAVADLNTELVARLTAEAETRPSVRRSNAGGWHSVPDLSQRPDACFQRLMELVAAHAQILLLEVAAAQGVRPERRYAVGIQAWAMVMKDGGYSVVHDHAQAHWSAVYYADTGDADLATHPTSGQFVLLDPRRPSAEINGLDLFPSQFGVQPTTGMLVFFPGSVQHFVHPYRGSRPRVSISCNLRFEPEIPGKSQAAAPY